MRTPARDAQAATECTRLIALLSESNLPHGKTLAVVVAKRLLAILEHGAGPAHEQSELDTWAMLARKLCEPLRPRKGLVI